METHILAMIVQPYPGSLWPLRPLLLLVAPAYLQGGQEAPCADPSPQTQRVAQTVLHARVEQSLEVVAAARQQGALYREPHVLHSHLESGDMGIL